MCAHAQPVFRRFGFPVATVTSDNIHINITDQWFCCCVDARPHCVQLQHRPSSSRNNLMIDTRLTRFQAPDCDLLCCSFDSALFYILVEDFMLMCAYVGKAVACAYPGSAVRRNYIRTAHTCMLTMLHSRFRRRRFYRIRARAHQHFLLGTPLRRTHKHTHTPFQ